MSYQNSRVCELRKKANVKPSRLLVEREKFGKHVTVSAGVCFGGKGRLHFVEDKAKVAGAYYVGHLLQNLVDDSNRLMPTGFIFQQYGASPDTARHQTQRTARRTGCGSSVQVFSQRTSGLQIRRM